MAEVIAHIMAGRSLHEVYDLTGVSRARLNRWVRSEPAFQQMFDELSADVQKAVRDELIAGVADRLSELLPDAVETLADVMGNGKGSERVAAAAHIFRLAGIGPKAPTGPGTPPPSIESLVAKIPDGSDSPGD